MIHIGEMITELLKKQHKTKKQFSDEIGVAASNVSHITKKASLDVVMLHRVGKALKYNFFKHFPVEEEAVLAESIPRTDEKDKVIEELKGVIAEHMKAAERWKEEELRLNREIDMLNKEKGYLMEINVLLKKK